MATIVTINASDQITNSRADLNTNFTNLNSDKIETSVLDTDTALAANSDAKIPSQKAIKAYVDAQTLTGLTIETTAGATHSLTTTASQKVVVFVKGRLATNGSTSNNLVTLAYNGVSKDTVQMGGEIVPFALMYTETPGAATHDITVSVNNGSVETVVIIVLKY